MSIYHSTVTKDDRNRADSIVVAGKLAVDLPLTPRDADAITRLLNNHDALLAEVSRLEKVLKMVARKTYSSSTARVDGDVTFTHQEWGLVMEAVA